MSEKKNKNTEIIATGLSSAAGSLMGTVSANAAMNRIKDIDQQSDDDIDAQNTETSGDVVVISHSQDDIQANVIEQPSPSHITTSNPIANETPEPIMVEPEPNTDVDIMYAGPAPEPDLIDVDIEPIVCLYGPPEPDFLNDIDEPADDFLADI